MVQSMVYGVKSGLATTFGLVSGCLVHTFLIAFGVSVLIEQSELALTILKTIGALYLLLLAYKVFRSEASISITASFQVKISYTALSLLGFMMNVLTPKVAFVIFALHPDYIF